jgi:hypothetical protein
VAAPAILGLVGYRRVMTAAAPEGANRAANYNDRANLRHPLRITPPGYVGLPEKPALPSVQPIAQASPSGGSPGEPGT